MFSRTQVCLVTEPLVIVIGSNEGSWYMTVVLHTCFDFLVVEKLYKSIVILVCVHCISHAWEYVGIEMYLTYLNIN